MTSTSSSAAAPRRNPVAVTIDIIASVALILIGLGLALTIVTWAAAFSGAAASCGAGPYEGLQCNGTVLGIVVIALYAVAIIGFFLAFGMFIVNLIRKRYTFWWPLGAVVAMIVAFFIGSWLVGMILPVA